MRSYGAAWAFWVAYDGWLYQEELFCFSIASVVCLILVDSSMRRLRLSGLAFLRQDKDLLVAWSWNESDATPRTREESQ